MSGVSARALRPPGPVIDLARTLQDAGHATWCVGGAVRDALLGLAHLDWDLATSATPGEVRRLFRRTIPVGIEFGTVGVLDREGRMHEVTTFRRDVHTDGRHAVVEFGASLDEDLARRDFTINAIAWDPIGKVLHDPFQGREDLMAGVVRAVGLPEDRMREDRLRALRAIRFASRFEFAIEAQTWAAIVASAPYLTRLSPERVKQELDKTMEQVACPSTAFRRWRDAGAFASLIPALASVPDATLAALDRLPRPGRVARPRRRMLRTAALFSALDGKATEQALRALRASNQEVSVVGAVVDRWQRFGGQSLRSSRRVSFRRMRPSDASQPMSGVFVSTRSCGSGPPTGRVRLGFRLHSCGGSSGASRMSLSMIPSRSPISPWMAMICASMVSRQVRRLGVRCRRCCRPSSRTLRAIPVTI